MNDIGLLKPARRWHEFRLQTPVLVVLLVFPGCGLSKEELAFGRGFAYYDKGELDKSDADFDKARELTPETE